MMETENLRTASLYINNQLLSRGLLRDGQTIDFTHPGDSPGEVAATMGRVMAVVNDLILRRDRDAEHREALATTLRTVRAESLRQANDVQRLQEKHAEAQRKVGISEAAEAALQASLKTADAAIHRLKDEAARIKALAAQTRAACANEVRKRDRQIDGLRKAVVDAGRARGGARSIGVTSITVAGEILGGAADDHAEGGGGGDTTTGDSGYDLRAETNAFLAELAKGLSAENETLLGLVRTTTEQLREMSGWDNDNTNNNNNNNTDNGQALGSCAELADDLEAVVAHMRTILTNPSFVPIEEVVVREDEIHRLRDGWEKMETRWREAVHLIDGWRRRMQASGRPINVEDLKMGLRLSPVRVHNVDETAQGHGLGLRLPALREEDVEDSPSGMRHRHRQQSPTPAAPRQQLNLVPALGFADDLDLDLDDSDCASSIFVDDDDDDDDDDIDVDELDVEEPNVEILQQSTMLESSPLPAPPQLSPLRDSYTAGNRGPAAGVNPRKRARGEFPAIAEERTWEDLARDDGAPLPPPHLEKPQPQPQRSPRKKRVQPPPPPPPPPPVPPPPHRPVQQQEPDAERDLSASESSLDSILLVKPPASSEPAKTGQRVRNRVSPATAQPRRDEAAAAAATSSKLDRAPSVKKLPRSQGTAPGATRSRPQSRQDGDSDNSATKQQQQQQQQQVVRTVSGSSNASASATNTTTVTNSMPPPPTPNTGGGNNNNNRSPKRVNSRLPLPRPGGGGNVLPPPQQSPLSMATIAAKLAASEREADAARVRAKLKAARLGRQGQAQARTVSAASSNSNGNGSEVAGSGSSGGGGRRSNVESRDEPQLPDQDHDRDGGGGDDDDGPGGDQQQQQQQQAVDVYPERDQQRDREREEEREREREREEEEDELAGPAPVPVPVLPPPSLQPRKRDRERGDMKTRRTSRVASRRRSTLNARELETLISQGAR